MELHQHNQDSFFFNLPSFTSHSSLASTPNEDEQRENLDEGLDLDDEESSEDENENDDIHVEWHITPFALTFPAANNVPTPAQKDGGVLVKLRQGVWEKRIEQLRAFARANGHCCVPKNRQGLGGWAAYIQRLRRQNALSADKVRELDELGFAWGSGENESSPSPSPSPSPSSSSSSPRAPPLDSLLLDPEPLSRQTTTTEATKRNGEEEEEPKEEQREEGVEQEDNAGARGRSARMDEKLFAGRVYQLRKFKRKHGHLRLGRTSDLAKWLARMKRYQHVGLLPRDKEAVLRAAGVAFDGDRQPSPKQTRRRQYSGQDTTTGDQEWEVEAILDKRMVAAADDRTPPAPLYEVKWKGYDETTWEPLANLVGCAELLEEFESVGRKAEKQTARAAERSLGAVVSPPPSPAAQAAAAAVAQAPEAAEARKLAVYSNFPEADCTVALRLSSGCRDLALLWLYTEPREREWLESSVFRCRADQARSELGLPLDRKPHNLRAKRKRDYEVDENDDRVPEDDRGLSPTMTTATATAVALKKAKSEAMEDDEDVDKAQERERGGGKRTRAAKENQARRDEERARRNLAEREERKALRDRKKAEDWERRRAQVRQAREEQRYQQQLQQQHQQLQQLQLQQQQQLQLQQLQLQRQQQHTQQQQQQQQQQQLQRQQHIQQQPQQQQQQLQRQQQRQYIQQQMQRQQQRLQWPQQLQHIQQLQQQKQKRLQQQHQDLQYQDLLQHYRQQLQIDKHQQRAYGRPHPVGQQPAAAIPLPVPVPLPPPPPPGSLDAHLSLGAAEPQPRARGLSWADDRFKVVVVANTLADPGLAAEGGSQSTTAATAAAPAASDHHRAQPTKLNEGAQHNSVATGHWTTSRADEAAAEELKATEGKAACQWTIRGDQEDEEGEELKAMACNSGGVADDGEMWEEDPLLAGFW